MLNAAIAAEAQRTPGWSRVRGLLPRLAAAGVAFVMVVAIGIGISLVRPKPVTALGELANVAERVEIARAADGEYLYSTSTGVSINFRDGADIGRPELGAFAYLVPRTVETWIADDVMIVARTTMQPKFFDPAAERAYFEAGLDADDGIGQTTEDTLSMADQIIDQRDWPTSPGQLQQAMEAYASNEGSQVATDVQLVELAAVLLRETEASPRLRAAVLRVLEDLDVDVATTSDGGVSVAIEFVDGVRRLRVIEFDAQANLVREYETWVDGDRRLGVPAGTVVHEAAYSPVRVVTEIPRR